MKRLPQQLAVSLAVIGSTVLMGIRAALALAEYPQSILHLARLTLAAGLALISLVLVIEMILRKERCILALVQTRPTTLSIVVLFFTLLAGCLDLAASLVPFIYIPGFVVIGTVLWSKPRRLFLIAGGSALAVSLASRFTAPALHMEVGSMTAIAFALALFAADLVKRNLAPTEERLKLLEAENKELWHMSYHDPLTGVFNRRYAQKSGPALFDRAVRQHGNLHVLMIDIDHFKLVNDELGHDIGDVVLKAIAECAASFLRPQDLLIRWGGEEFLALLPDYGNEQAQFTANRIRDSVGTLHFEQIPWFITISIGITGIRAGDSLEGMIRRSDTFLYVSKNQGRNRVTGY